MVMLLCVLNPCLEPAASNRSSDEVTATGFKQRRVQDPFKCLGFAELADHSFGNHRNLPSLHTYILISQDEARVETFQRQANGDWIMSVIDGLDGELKLSQPAVSLKLADLYARVEFPEAEHESSKVNDGSSTENEK